jgi:tetratricopeptide (TPR) repeat protein
MTMSTPNRPDAIDLSPDEILNMSFISYATPLELAHRWALSGNGETLDKAIVLLKGLFDQYPHSLEIGQQLVLCHLEKGEEEPAREILQRLALLSRNPNEEVLARSGRLYRDRADRLLSDENLDKASATQIHALRMYQQALQEYQKAYLVRKGHYPGINVATLHLLIASLETNQAARAIHLGESQKLTKILLEDRAKWPSDHPEDVIWHAGTEGEAHLLLRDWETAGDCYRSVTGHAEVTPFQVNSMRKQVDRILAAYARLGADIGPPFDDVTTLLPTEEVNESAAPEE